MTEVGAVVIGRNEGERLERCLRSLKGSVRTIVYVDSGSTDGSMALARDLGAQVLELDRELPFTAARARNAGFDLLLQERPDAGYAFFVDGDCEIAGGFLERAAGELDGRPEVVAICGLLRERFPETSIYNRLCDIEWQAPCGEVEACGGIFLVRARPFLEAGRFDPEIRAGEEPELCQRLRQRGGKIVRLDTLMAWHDSAMLHFGQWQRRQVRNSYGAMDLALRGSRGRFIREILGAHAWALGWPAAVVLGGLLGYTWRGPWAGILLASGLAAVLVLQVLRVAWRSRRKTGTVRTALAYGAILSISKWPQVWGQWLCARDRLLAKKDRVFHMKKGGLKPPSAWQEDRRRYPRRPWFREQSIWSIAVYRFGRWNDRRPRGITRWVLERIYWRIFFLVETITGISFTKSVEIGPGLKVWHFGNIFINPEVKIGSHCTLRQGVTIGNRHEGGPVPVVGDHVEFGAYAQVFGGVHIGDGARIGAMAVVLQDVPPGATAVGNPARIIEAPRPTGSEMRDGHAVATDRVRSGEAAS